MANAEFKPLKSNPQIDAFASSCLIVFGQMSESLLESLGIRKESFETISMVLIVLSYINYNKSFNKTYSYEAAEEAATNAVRNAIVKNEFKQYLVDEQFYMRNVSNFFKKSFRMPLDIIINQVVERIIYLTETNEHNPEMSRKAEPYRVFMHYLQLIDQS